MTLIASDMENNLDLNGYILAAEDKISIFKNTVGGRNINIC